MKSKTKKRWSLIHLLLSQFILYLIVVLVGVVIWVLISFKILDEISSLIQPSEMIRLEKPLKAGKYKSIDFRPYNIYGTTYEIVSYERGLVYASNPATAQKFTSDELDLILPYNANYYYTSMKYTSPESGKHRYLIQKNTNKGDRYLVGVLPVESEEFAYLLDEKMNIISQNLSSGRSRFSKRDIQILTQSLQDKYHLYKYDFVDNKGEKMAFVIMKTYNLDLEDKAINDHILITVVILLVTVILFMILFIWRLHRKISKPLTVLNEAITKLVNRDEVVVYEDSGAPQEFATIFNTFNEVSAELYESQRQRHEIEESKKKMLANISHDLRTPITVIQGYSKALSDQMIAEDTRNRYMQIIYQKSVVLNELIESLYEFSQIQHPEFTLQTERLDFCEYLRHYWAQHYDEFILQEYELDIDIPEERYMIDLDIVKFTRVLDNLLNNFMRYNPPHTTLAFHLQCEKQFVKLEIADDGVEIREEIAATLFQPFVTGVEARTAGKGGTGLGLAIVQQFVEMHGGTITLETKNIAPYTKAFVIRLPLSLSGI